MRIGFSGISLAAPIWESNCFAPDPLGGLPAFPAFAQGKRPGDLRGGWHIAEWVRRYLRARRGWKAVHSLIL
jgi:hypothetical protein